MYAPCACVLCKKYYVIAKYYAHAQILHPEYHDYLTDNSVAVVSVQLIRPLPLLTGSPAASLTSSLTPTYSPALCCLLLSRHVRYCS